MNCNEIIEFTKEVFNTFNKIVVKDKEIKLYFDMTRGDIYGYLNNPNVFICPNTILGFSNVDDYIKTLILHVVCHELFHVSQYINLDRYQASSKYNRLIEADNDIGAINFIILNQIYIEKLFKFNINRRYLDRIQEAAISFIDYMYAERSIPIIRLDADISVPIIKK